MPRTIVYKAGGFTNCGIGYTKFSQEELAEMKDRVMTENEAIKILRKDSCYECAQGTDSPVNCEYRECRVAEATRAAIKALEEIQQYRALETRLAEMFGGALCLEIVIDELERQLKEPDNPHPINAKILTYEDAADWDAYRAIGTPEECKKSVSVCRAMIERNITPENMEEYMKFEDECVKCGFTLKSLLEAREKQIPYKPSRKKLVWGIGKCKCGVEFLDRQTGFCGNCGQKLDWEGKQ